MSIRTLSAATSAAGWACGAWPCRCASSGRTRPNASCGGLEEPWPGDHAGRLAEAGLSPNLAGEALGTIGGGNHFAELLRVETLHGGTEVDPAALYLMVHSGSRGLG